MKTTVILALAGALLGAIVASFIVPPALAWYTSPGGLPQGAIGILIYARVTRERDAIGRWGFWSFVASLALVYVLSIFAPPPPSVKVLALVTIALGLLFIFWAWWLDRHREVR